MASRDPWEDRTQRAYDYSGRKPVRSGFIALAIILAIGAVLGVAGCAAGWFSGTTKLASFGHSKEQVTIVLDDWTKLEATAGNVCNISQRPKTEDDPTLVEDPAFAYKATYLRIKADYDRRMSNFFEAAVTRQLPIPATLKGYPERAPTLRQMQDQVC